MIAFAGPYFLIERFLPTDARRLGAFPAALPPRCHGGVRGATCCLPIWSWKEARGLPRFGEFIIFAYGEAFVLLEGETGGGDGTAEHRIRSSPPTHRDPARDERPRSAEEA